MSKPKLLDAYTKESKTIAAINSEYAIVAEWTDGNYPNNENRVGLFVTRDITNNEADIDGVFISKAREDSKILGVTVDRPGFAANVSKESCSNHDGLELHLSKSYVCFSGYASVIDDGSLAVGDTCKPSNDGSGTARKSTSGGGFKVIYRIDSNHILIHIDPLLQIDVSGSKLIISY